MTPSYIAAPSMSLASAFARFMAMYNASSPFCFNGTLAVWSMSSDETM
jgi:hypothetical protein